MPQKRKSKQRKARNRDGDGNFVGHAQPGCHVVRHSTPWLVGVDAFDLDEMGLGPDDHVPDFSVDPESCLLSVLNPDASEKTYFMTLEHGLRTAAGSLLSSGSYRDADGEWHRDSCVTLVVVAPPRSVMDIAYVELPAGAELSDIKIHSDVKPLVPHPTPSSFDSRHVYPFPLRGVKNKPSTSPSSSDTNTSGLASKLGFGGSRRSTARILPGINRPPLGTVQPKEEKQVDAATAAAIAEKRAKRRERRIEKVKQKQAQREQALRDAVVEQRKRADEEMKWRATHEQKRLNQKGRVRSDFRYSIDQLLALEPKSTSSHQLTEPVPEVPAQVEDASTNTFGFGFTLSQTDAEESANSSEAQPGAFGFAFGLTSANDSAGAVVSANTTTDKQDESSALAQLSLSQEESKSEIGTDEAFLCTQGMGGHFTHFYAGTLHAVDFACPVGTDVLSVGDGTVVEVKTENRVGGINVQNLFHWNSIMIQLDDGAVAEYVHVDTASELVKPGDRVTAGQVICKSGDVGFCPTPHLHFQMHKSTAADAPTIKFGFRDAAGGHYFPVAGKWYNASGLRPAPSHVNSSAKSSKT